MPAFDVVKLERVYKQSFNFAEFCLDCNVAFSNYLIDSLDKNLLKNVELFRRSAQNFEHLIDSWRMPRIWGFKDGVLGERQRVVFSGACDYLSDSEKFRISGHWNKFDDPFLNYRLGYALGFEDFEKGIRTFDEIFWSRNDKHLLKKIGICINTTPHVSLPESRFIRYLVDREEIKSKNSQQPLLTVMLN